MTLIFVRICSETSVFYSSARIQVRPEELSARFFMHRVKHAHQSIFDAERLYERSFQNSRDSTLLACWYPSPSIMWDTNKVQANSSYNGVTLTHCYPIFGLKMIAAHCMRHRLTLPLIPWLTAADHDYWSIEHDPRATSVAVSSAAAPQSAPQQAASPLEPR